MNKLLLSLLLLIFAFSNCEAQKQNQVPIWKEFVSKDGNFKILFPTVPKESTHEAGEGEFKVQNHRFSVFQLHKTFMIAYTYYPNAPTMNQDELKSYYETLQNGIVKQMNGRLINEGDVLTDTKIGREFIFSDSNKAVTIYQMYLIDKRMFQLIVTFDSSLFEIEAEKKEANRFLNSFQVLDK